MSRKGDGSIFKRGNSYWVSYYLNGQQQREAAKGRDGKNTDDPQVAERFLKAIIKRVHGDQVGGLPFETPQSRRLTVADLLDALKAKFELKGKASAQNLSHVRRATADFGHYRAVGFSTQTISDYQKERLAKGDKPASINRVLQMLRQAFNLAVREKRIATVPFIEMLSEKGNARKGFFGELEFRAVLSHLPEDLKDFARYCYATGSRKGEAASITWTMVAGDELRIPGDICKNRRPRTLPISGEVAEVIDRCRSARRIEESGTVHLSEYVFHRDGDSGPIHEFRKSWARACVAAKLGAMICPKCESEGDALTCPECKTATKYRGKIFHDFRRSAVRNMVKAGIPIQKAKAWSGHASDSIFERYSILTTDDLRDTLHQTEQYREQAAQQAEQRIVAVR